MDIRPGKISLGLIFAALCACSTPKNQIDIVIVGGGASGVTAGIEAARLGSKAIILEETPWLGGMLTSAGVSAIDGNHKLPSGLWHEFRDSLIGRYGSAEALETGWVSNVLFEPSVGNQIWKNIVAKEPNLKVHHEARLKNISKKEDVWTITYEEAGKEVTIETKVLIDATELGDVAKMAGVKYDIGMESQAVSGENIAPEACNDIIQDLTYVAVLKDFGPNADMTIEKPANYDPSPFYCACKTSQCTNPKEKQRVWSCEEMLTYGKLPNDKYMINWPIEGNDYYLNLLEMTPEEREEALKDAKAFTLNFLYFMQTELGYKNLGLADDEYPTADKLPFIPYHRESRRIHGLARFNVNHVAKPYDQKEALYRTGIAVGDYPVDHHHARYPDWHKLPDLHFYPVPSYALPLGTLIPKDVKGLIVAEKSISVSNLVNGTTRLQPVVLQIGQAAGALAALAVQQNKDVADVPVRDVQNTLLNDGVYLQPYLDLEKHDPHFKALQRIGSTGLLKAVGMNVGWSNQTWFKADSVVTKEELGIGLKNLYPSYTLNVPNETLTLSDAFKVIKDIQSSQGLKSEELNSDYWSSLGLSEFDLSRMITRKEFAVLVDETLDPFNTMQVNHQGAYLIK